MKEISPCVFTFFLVTQGTFNKHARGSTDLYTFKEFPQYKVAPSPTIQLVSPTFTLAIRLEISAVGVYENIGVYIIECPPGTVAAVNS